MCVWKNSRNSFVCVCVCGFFWGIRWTDEPKDQMDFDLIFIVLYRRTKQKKTTDCSSEWILDVISYYMYKICNRFKCTIVALLFVSTRERLSSYAHWCYLCFPLVLLVSFFMIFYSILYFIVSFFYYYLYYIL